jgi:hypothetical protein
MAASAIRAPAKLEINHSVRKIVLLGIAGHVLERPHGDGRFVRQRRGRI